MSLREASLMGMKVRRICLLHLGAPCINGGNGDFMFLRRSWWRRSVKERESSRCRVRVGDNTCRNSWMQRAPMVKENIGRHSFASFAGSSRRVSQSN